MSINLIENLIALYEGVNLSFSHHQLIGKDILVDEGSLALLQSLDEDNSGQIEIEIEKEGVNIISSIALGEEISLTITLHRSVGFFFGKNLSDLLESSGSRYCYEKPTISYLAEENWKSWDEGEQKQSIHAYLNILGFITLLKNTVANHSDSDELIFFGTREKLTLPIHYTVKNIERSPGKILDSLAVINALMDGKEHKKDKGVQLKAIIIDVLTHLNEKDRFSFLIENIDEVAARFTHNHDLFVSGFSFEDKKEQLKTENRKYTAEMNSAINSIHARIIGIPVGTLGTALLLKTQTVIDQGLEPIILFSAIFIIFVIAVSLISQMLLLLKIRVEYHEKWKRMKTKIPNLLEEVQSEYNNLEKHFYLNTSLIVFFFISLIIFSYYPLSIYLEFSIIDVFTNASKEASP